MPSWLFAQIYDRGSRREPLNLREARKRLVAGLSGEILEVGVGNGLNLARYPGDAHVTATDYNQHMLRKAEGRASAARAEVDLRRADVQDLPFETGRFDHVVAGLGFCSVDDPPGGLRELIRVTRPGGSVRLLEHVGATPGWMRRTQTALTPVWRRVADGCRLDQDTVAIVQRAGLVVDEVIYLPRLARIAPLRLIYAERPLVATKSRAAEITTERGTVLVDDPACDFVVVCAYVLSVGSSGPGETAGSSWPWPPSRWSTHCPWAGWHAPLTVLAVLVAAAWVHSSQQQAFRRALRRAQAQIGELRNRADAFELAATVDSTTQLANRLAFYAALSETLAKPLTGLRGAPALILIGLDRFKTINDTYGHTAGDAVLVRIARILQQESESGDQAGRLGGDEFGLLIRRTTPEDLARLMRRVQAAAESRPLYVSPMGEEVFGSFSLGAACSPSTPTSMNY
jgi:diguanylate cyclase (GGDEF)-like protein